SSTTPFPGTALEVSRVGFGSPWMGSSPDRSPDLSRALVQGKCNLIELQPELPPGPHGSGSSAEDSETYARGWETEMLAQLQVRRGFVLSLEAK
ncbi:unnamed protein product, partial [Choristocarpus tenellus]